MAHPPQPPPAEHTGRLQPSSRGTGSTPRTPTSRTPLPPTLIGPRPAGWLLIPTVVTGLLVVGYVLMRLYDRFVAPIPSDTRTLFHITTEGGVVTWWNSTLLLGIATLALLLAALSGPGRPSRQRTGRASWLMAAIVAGYLSLDESVELHERLGGPADRLFGGESTTLFTFAWVFPGAVLTFVGCVLAARWTRRLPFDLRMGVFAAVATYVTGALGLEALNGWLKRQNADLAMQIGTLLEEALEMGGCLVALATFAAALVLTRDASGRVVLTLRPDLADPRAARLGARPYDSRPFVPYVATGTNVADSTGPVGPAGSTGSTSSTGTAGPAGTAATDDATRSGTVTGGLSEASRSGWTGRPPEDPEEAALRPDPRDEMR